MTLPDNLCELSFEIHDNAVLRSVWATIEKKSPEGGRTTVLAELLGRGSVSGFTGRPTNDVTDFGDDLKWPSNTMTTWSCWGGGEREIVEPETR